VVALDPTNGADSWRTTVAPAIGATDSLHACDDDSPLASLTATDDTVLMALRVGIEENFEGAMGAVALEAATGDLRWKRSVPGVGNGTAIAADPEGDLVVLGGSSGFAAVAVYRVATGEREWLRRYRRESVRALEVSSDGTSVFLAGYTLRSRYWTASLNVADGSVGWQRTQRDRDDRHGVGGVAVSPDGRHLYVGGWVCFARADDPASDLPLCLRDVAVLRYRTADGRGGVWAVHDGPYRTGLEMAADLTVTGGGRVVVAALSQVGPAPNLCGRYVCRIDYDVTTIAFEPRMRQQAS
jgi:outer membrane protein assembly factor BamB